MIHFVQSKCIIACNLIAYVLLCQVEISFSFRTVTKDFIQRKKVQSTENQRKWEKGCAGECTTSDLTNIITPTQGSNLSTTYIITPTQGSNLSPPCLANTSDMELADLTLWRKKALIPIDNSLISFRWKWNFQGLVFHLDTHAIKLEESLSIISIPPYLRENKRRPLRMASTFASLESHTPTYLKT